MLKSVHPEKCKFLLLCRSKVMSSELKKRLTKTVSSDVTSSKKASTDVSQDVVKLERSYTTIGVSSDQKSSVETSPAFPSLGSSACYQREASSLSTASLPGGSPVKSLSKSRIPIATFSRENLSSGRSTPSNLPKLQKPGFGSLNSCNTLGLSTSSLAESLTGTSPFKYSRNGLGQVKDRTPFRKEPIFLILYLLDNVLEQWFSTFVLARPT